MKKCIKCLVNKNIYEFREYKTEDYIQSYKNYYVNAKKSFAKYTNVNVPEFMIA